MRKSLATQPVAVVTPRRALLDIRNPLVCITLVLRLWEVVRARLTHAHWQGVTSRGSGQVVGVHVTKFALNHLVAVGELCHCLSTPCEEVLLRRWKGHRRQ